MPKLTDLVRPLVLMQPITGLDGESATDLDSIDTLNLSAGVLGFASISDLVHFYKLESGTDAQSLPNVVRPHDYAASTNEKVWKLKTHYGAAAGAASSTDNALARFDGTTGKVLQNSGVTVDDSVNLGLGTSSFGSSAAKVISIGSGTAPTTSPADVAQLWVADQYNTAGQAALHLRTESGSKIHFGRQWHWENPDYAPFFRIVSGHPGGTTQDGNGLFQFEFNGFVSSANTPSISLIGQALENWTGSANGSLFQIAVAPIGGTQATLVSLADSSLILHNTGAPTLSFVDSVRFSVADAAGAGTASLHVRDEAGGVVVLGNNGAIKTGNPSGGTAEFFKVGAAASVSPTSPNRTIEIDIAGTRYFLHAKTTND